MDQFRNKRVFISGGNGVIGNAMVEKLHSAGAIVLVGDLKPRPNHWPTEIKYRQGDLNYISKEELDKFQPEYFFHLAATFERSAESYAFWYENFQHNVKLGNHLMTCLKDNTSLRKVIFASSYLIYDPALYQFSSPHEAYSLKETDPIYPRNLTGVAKLLHEIELRFINDFRRDQFKIVSARIFRGHGLGSKDIISRWIRSLLNQEQITVYRKEGVFDYIFSEDSAEGLLRLAAADKAEGVVNLGTGRSRSVKDVLEILKTHFPELQFSEDDATVNIPFESSQANIELLVELTGWRPEHSLEQSIEKMVSYEVQNRKSKGSASSMAKFNVLVTSISAKVPLLKCVSDGIRKTGFASKLFGGDLDDNCVGKHFVDVFWKMPRLNEENLQSIINYCIENEITAIIPTRDGELAYFAAARNEFLKNGISVMVSDYETVLATVDKLQFYLAGASKNYPVIETLEDIRGIRGGLVVKERFGAGARSIGLNLGLEDAEKHAKTLSQPIFQPFVKGEEFSVDMYIAKDGTVKGAVCRSRDKVVNGESQITVMRHETRLEELCIRFAEDFNFYGHILFQVIKDYAGQFHIVECNARFGGASSLSVAGGLDSFYWFLLESSGTCLEQYPFVRSKESLRQIRFASDLIERAN
jgi:carbamoyl-phosphate synthase large subunit